MRGTFVIGIDGTYGLGIIPAYAGNIYDIILKMAISRDHPRVCGEHAYCYT